MHCQERGRAKKEVWIPFPMLTTPCPPPLAECNTQSSLLRNLGVFFIPQGSFLFPVLHPVCYWCPSPLSLSWILCWWCEVELEVGVVDEAGNKGA
jgi:hypothetical protein